MPQILDSLTSFKQLWSSNMDAGFNIFFGAGISRDPPTNGPIWTEMQTGFLGGLFDRMKADGWPILSEYPDDQSIANELDIRPEIFWARIIEFSKSKVVWRALEAADLGLPNANHERIATLLTSGRCKVAMTTNFDEHVETFLSKEVPVYVPTQVEEFNPLGVPTYVKLHGTISNGLSLSYTLEQYDQLKNRNENLIKWFSNRPLLIMGYSGFDTDVCPALQIAARSSLFTVIIQHPGSSINQPIFDLACEGSTTYVMESSCNGLLGILVQGLSESDYSNIIPRRGNSSSEIYRKASEMLPMPYCPYLLMNAFHISGNWEMVRRYAWLTHDACGDERYRNQITDQEFQEIHCYLAGLFKSAGDETGREAMLALARPSSDAKMSETMRHLIAQVGSCNAPDQSLLKARLPIPSRSTMGPLNPKLLGLSVGFLPGTVDSKHAQFIHYWDLGNFELRERKFEKSIEAFKKGSTLFCENVGTHLERGRFLLDCGNSLFQQSLQNLSDEILDQANKSFQMAEMLTRDIGDWETNAKAHLMLARIVAISGLIERAREYASKALESVSRTQDAALRSRIEEFFRGLDDLEKNTLE